MAVTKEEKGFCMYPAYRDFLIALSDSDRGQLLMSLFDFYDGVDTSRRLPDGARMAFVMIAGRMQQDMARYQKRCKTNQENASKRWPVRTPEETDDSEEDG